MTRDAPLKFIPPQDEERLGATAQRWLAFLRENWGTAYEFGVDAADGRTYVAARRDDGTALAHGEPGLLLQRVRRDYNARPVSR